MHVPESSSPGHTSFSSEDDSQTSSPADKPDQHVPAGDSRPSYTGDKPDPAARDTHTSSPGGKPGPATAAAGKLRATRRLNMPQVISEYFL